PEQAAEDKHCLRGWPQSIDCRAKSHIPQPPQSLVQAPEPSLLTPLVTRRCAPPLICGEVLTRRRSKPRVGQLRKPHTHSFLRGLMTDDQCQSTCSGRQQINQWSNAGSRTDFSEAQHG